MIPNVLLKSASRVREHAAARKALGWILGALDYQFKPVKTFPIQALLIFSLDILVFWYDKCPQSIPLKILDSSLEEKKWSVGICGIFWTLGVPAYATGHVLGLFLFEEPVVSKTDGKPLSLIHSRHMTYHYKSHWAVIERSREAQTLYIILIFNRPSTYCCRDLIRHFYQPTALLASLSLSLSGPSFVDFC